MTACPLPIGYISQAGISMPSYGAYSVFPTASYSPYTSILHQPCCSPFSFLIHIPVFWFFIPIDTMLQVYMPEHPLLVHPVFLLLCHPQKQNKPLRYLLFLLYNRFWSLPEHGKADSSVLP